jgi:hypothetical protein
MSAVWSSLASRVARDRSSWVLIAANLLPLVWAAKEGWSGRDMVTLYWMEVGLFWAVILLKIGLYAFLWEPAGPEEATDRTTLTVGLLFVFCFTTLPAALFWILVGLLQAKLRHAPWLGLEALELVKAMLEQARLEATGRFRGLLVALVTAHLFSVTYDFVLRKEWKKHRIEHFAMEFPIRVVIFWTLVTAGNLVAGTITWLLRNVLGLERAASLGWFAALFLVKVWMDLILRHQERESGGVSLRALRRKA